MLYFYFDLFESFQCRMCGRCCRNDWLVTIDEACFRRNHEVFCRAGREAEFHEVFTPIAQPGFGEYAVIGKQPQGGCWFLGSDSLCQLQKAAGHQHLDTVCQTFPRYPINTTRGIELTLSFSCPAVIELASQSQVTLLRSENKPKAISSEAFVTFVYPGQHPANQPLHYYFELEQYFIELLQCRSLPLAERVSSIVDTARQLVSGRMDDPGRELARLLNRNYDAIAELPPAGAPPAPGLILAENFLVNMVFKKLFYEQGLQQGAEILALLWRQLRLALESCPDTESRLAEVILDLEFEYSHHRRRFMDKWLNKPYAG